MLRRYLVLLSIALVILFAGCAQFQQPENEDEFLHNTILGLTGMFIACPQSALNPRVDTVNGLTRIYVLPSYTGVCLVQYNDPHLMYVPSTGTKNLLSVFLPGSGGTPIGVAAIVEEGAARGYHSIGLMYPNADPINVICNSGANNSASCFGSAREEIITGADRTTAVAVDVNNSIDGRLLRLLQYFSTRRPNDGWGQFLVSGRVDWSKVYMGGHSQGSGHAAYEGKLKSLARVSLYSGVSDYHINSASIAPWLSASSQTAAASYYGFVHVGDTVANFSGNANQVTDAWLSPLGMTGALTDADSGNAPYGSTHRLTTNLCSTSDDNTKHGCTMLSSQKAVWDYVSFP